MKMLRLNGMPRQFRYLRYRRTQVIVRFDSHAGDVSRSLSRSRLGTGEEWDRSSIISTERGYVLGNSRKGLNKSSGLDKSD